MKPRASIITALQKLIPELRERYGVESLSLFGSCARSEDGAASDVDLLVTFEPNARVTLFTLAAMTRELEAALGRPVDLVEDHKTLRPAFRKAIEKDLLRVA